MHTIKRKSREGRKCMKVKRGTSEKYKEYPFKPCSQNGSVALPYSHSLSFHLLYNYSKLTIFNSFNSIAHEFSVESFRMEILRVFASLAIACKTTYCKHIEDRPKKDGVLTVRKRRLFSRKRRVSGAKTKSFESKDFVFLRKNAVFFSERLETLSKNCRFFSDLTPVRNIFPQNRLVHFVALRLME